MSELSWAVVRLAGRWRDGVLPEEGGVQDQAAWIVAAIEIVLGAWARLEAERWRKTKGD